MSGNTKQATQQKGFTLIEAIVAVAIIAILSSIGYPLYNSQSRKGKRAEAITGLAIAQGDMEHCYLNNTNGTYTGAIICAPTNQGLTPPSGSYNIAAVVAAQTYTLTATPQGTQANDPCGSFVINEQGTKTVTGAAAIQACWRN